MIANLSAKYANDVRVRVGIFIMTLLFQRGQSTSEHAVSIPRDFLNLLRGMIRVEQRFAVC